MDGGELSSRKARAAAVANYLSHVRESGTEAFAAMDHNPTDIFEGRLAPERESSVCPLRAKTRALWAASHAHRPDSIRPNESRQEVLMVVGDCRRVDRNLPEECARIVAAAMTSSTVSGGVAVGLV